MYKKERYYPAKKVYLNVVHNNTSNHIGGGRGLRLSTYNAYILLLPPIFGG
jgi:hypothetical protein